MNSKEVKLACDEVGISFRDAIMSQEDCEAGPYPHNRRIRFTDGMWCEDCGSWFNKEEQKKWGEE